MSSLEAIADAFFAAGSSFDWSALGALLAPGVQLRQNGARLTVEDLQKNVEAMAKSVRYSDVRRVVGDDAIVEQHTVTLELHTGQTLELPDVCVVMRVDPQGRITSLDEYLPNLPG